MGHGSEPLIVAATTDVGVVQVVGPVFQQWGCRLAAVPDATRLWQLLDAEAPALVLFDPALAGATPDVLLDRLLAEKTTLPVVVMTRPGSTLAVPMGVFDELAWPPDVGRLRWILAHAVERHRLLEQIRQLEGRMAAAAKPEAPDATLPTIDQMANRAIVAALRRTRGNVREAARLLGLGQATVYRKIKRFHIARQDYSALPAMDLTGPPRCGA